MKNVVFKGDAWYIKNNFKVFNYKKSKWMIKITSENVSPGTPKKHRKTIDKHQNITYH